MIDLSRRDVLKGGGLLGLSVLVHWIVPGSDAVKAFSTRAVDVPAEANEAFIQYGNVVQVTPAALIIDPRLEKWANERLTRSLGEIAAPEGWVLTELVKEERFHTPVGGDHDDPLRACHVFGLKQTWKMVRV